MLEKRATTCTKNEWPSIIGFLLARGFVRMYSGRYDTCVEEYLTHNVALAGALKRLAGVFKLYSVECSNIHPASKAEKCMRWIPKSVTSHDLEILKINIED